MPGARIVITGASGLVGARLLDLAHREGRSTWPAPDAVARERLGLDDPAAAARGLDALRPAAVIHAAAITSIAAAEADPERARRVNVEATAALAEVAARRGIPFVFLSTDQVWDGRRAPYASDDPPAPLSGYGRGKADAEAAVLAAGPRTAVLRLALVFGRSPDGRRSASEMILRAAEEGRTLDLFEDEFRQPVSVERVARVALLALERDFRGRLAVGGPEGLSRLDFGRRVAAAAGLDPAFIRPASLAARTFTPPRPPDLRLDLSDLFGLAGEDEPLDEALRREHAL
ncbi:MAG: sugar nucleotide-binding protein [Planctomycetota bacterium]